MGFDIDVITVCLEDSKDEIYNGIKECIEDQPYSVTCSNCGEPLEYTKKIDNDLDLTLDIEPCKCKGE